MDKVSYYNITIQHKDCKLLYNALSNSLVCLTDQEYEQIHEYMEDLEAFFEEYPVLYEKFKKCGFIVDEDTNELDYLKLMNNMMIYENQRYHLTINPTLDCNLRCGYCSTEYAKALHQGCMNQDTIEALKKHITFLVKQKRIPALHLDWFGGEPLMYFKEIVEPIAKHTYDLIKEYGVVFTQHATTNSVFMTEEMMRAMSDLHFTSFQIPIDGNERHHNVIKFEDGHVGTFKTIINNINLLPEIISDVNITLRVNYDKKTLYGIEEIIPFISEKAKKHITVDFQKVWQIKCDEKDDEQLKIVRSIFTKNGFNTDFWAFAPKTYHRCYADRLHQYAINYDGRVFKCTAQNYGDDKVIGVLQKDGQIEWNYNLLSKLFSHSTFDNKKCLSCKILPICWGPCIIRCKEARDGNWPMPCVEESSQSTVSEFIIGEAVKRKLITA